MAHYGYEWVLEKYTIREYGVIIEGSPPQALIDPITSIELRQASLKILDEWWAPMLLDTSRLRGSDYQACAILTMCRILHMFAHGTIVSKKNAAEWAQNTMDKGWKTLIGEALKWEKHTPFEHFDETIEFIRFTLEYVNISNKI